MSNSLRRYNEMRERSNYEILVLGLNSLVDNLVPDHSCGKFYYPLKTFRQNLNMTNCSDTTSQNTDY